MLPHYGDALGEATGKANVAAGEAEPAGLSPDDGVPVAPYDYDSNPPIGRYGYGSAPPSHQWQPQQHVYQGSFPARFVGITPDGNLILRFPDGQTAIVPARAYHNNRTHRRRVIIERRYGTPQQPFYPPPFYPPDA